MRINGTDTSQAKILQYCDDTTLIVKTLEDLIKAIEVIDEFYFVSGLKLNKEKSMGFWIGGSRNNKEVPTIVSWKSKNEYIKILGVYFNPFVDASNIDLNWVKKLIKLKALSNSYKNEKLVFLVKFCCVKHIYTHFSHMYYNLYHFLKM